MNKKKEISSYVYFAVYASIFWVSGKLLHGHGMGMLYLRLSAYTILGIVGVVIFGEYYKEAFTQWKEKTIKCMLWIVGASVVHVILENIFYVPLYMYNPDYESLNQNNVSSLKGVIPMWLAILILAILGPMVEEHIYRVLMIRKQEGRLPAVVSILLSSVCFMMLHVHSLTIEEILANLPILATGLVYGFVVYKTKNITLPMVMHILMNLPAVISMYLGA